MITVLKYLRECHKQDGEQFPPLATEDRTRMNYCKVGKQIHAKPQKKNFQNSGARHL